MRKQNGQLAIGLAFAFTAVLAIFGMIYNSAMITREKMKLQQTTDFAALAASNLQRAGLNRIRELNERIEIEYTATLAALQPPFCPLLWPDVSSQAVLVGAKVEAILGKPAGTYGPNCVLACADFDAYIRGEIIRGYELLRSFAAADIAAIASETNEHAADIAMDVFLTPRNLPFGLMRMLKNKLGANLSLQSIRTAYAGGELPLKINDANSSTPLFIAAAEPRTFQYLRYPYAVAGIVGTPLCAMAPSAPLPGVALSAAKIVKKGDLSTFYLASASYTPRNTFVDEKFNLLLKESDPEERKTIQQRMVDIRGKYIPLFSKNDPATGDSKPAMTAMSLAKPYGGTFPEAGDITGLVSRGTAGKEFKGVKLAGIADRAELGGFDLGHYLGMPWTFLSGSELNREDFLH